MTLSEAWAGTRCRRIFFSKRIIWSYDLVLIIEKLSTPLIIYTRLTPGKAVDRNDEFPESAYWWYAVPDQIFEVDPRIAPQGKNTCQAKEIQRGRKPQIKSQPDGDERATNQARWGKLSITKGLNYNLRAGVSWFACHGIGANKQQKNNFFLWPWGRQINFAVDVKVQGFRKQQQQIFQALAKRI